MRIELINNSFIMRIVYAILIIFLSSSLYSQEKTKSRINDESCNCQEKKEFIAQSTFSWLESIQNSLFDENDEKKIEYQLNYSKEGAIILFSGVSYFVPKYFFQNKNNLTFSEIELLDKNNINKFDRGVTSNYSEQSDDLSYYILYGLAASPALMLLNKELKNDIVKIGLMYSETLFLAGALPQWTKESIKRYRPFIYNDSVVIEKKIDVDSRRSFFSGHTSLAFSSASFITKIWSDYFPKSEYTKYIASGAFLTAGAIGWLRIDAGKHFYTDVLTGAAIGTICGYLIPELHRINKKDNITLSISTNQINFSYKF